MPELFIWIYFAVFAAMFIFGAVFRFVRAANGHKVKPGLLGPFVASALWPVALPAMALSVLVVAVMAAKSGNPDEYIYNLRKANEDA